MRTFRYNLDGRILEVEIQERSGDSLLDLTVWEEESDQGRRALLSLPGARVVRRGSLIQVLSREGSLQGVVHVPPSGEAAVCLEGISYFLKDADLAAEEEDQGSGPDVQAPMPGRVVKVLVEKGALVKKGTPLLVVESMKMETEIAAGIDGVVEEVRVAPGDNVNPGDTLVRIQPPG